MNTSAPPLLMRRGAWLIGEHSAWQMHSVEGPLNMKGAEGQEFFRVETSSRATLVVARERGERGMRSLTLVSVSGG